MMKKRLILFISFLIPIFDNITLSAQKTAEISFEEYNIQRQTIQWATEGLPLSYKKRIAMYFIGIAVFMAIFWFKKSLRKPVMVFIAGVGFYFLSTLYSYVTLTNFENNFSKELVTRINAQENQKNIKDVVSLEPTYANTGVMVDSSVLKPNHKYNIYMRHSSHDYLSLLLFKQNRYFKTEFTYKPKTKQKIEYKHKDLKKFSKETSMCLSKKAFDSFNGSIHPAYKNDLGNILQQNLVFNPKRELDPLNPYDKKKPMEQFKEDKYCSNLRRYSYDNSDYKIVEYLDNKVIVWEGKK